MHDNQFIMVVGVVETCTDKVLGTIKCSIPGIYTSENGNTQGLPEIPPLTSFDKPPQRGDKAWVFIKIDNDIDYNEESQVLHHNQLKLMTDTSFYVPTKEPTDTELKFLTENAKNNGRILFCQENCDQVNSQIYDDVNGMVTSIGETNMQLGPAGDWTIQSTSTSIQSNGTDIEIGANKTDETANISTHSMALGDKVVEMFDKVIDTFDYLAYKFNTLDRIDIGTDLFNISNDMKDFKNELITDQVKINVNTNINI